ncbi:hypothetical protein MANI_001795 [Metarhizium anisopliae]
MPSVDVAMARSLRPAAWQLIRDAVARSVAQSLTKRDIVTEAQNQITDAKTAFSSWDNCMKAAFCKWPVIGVIIVGSLIILSIVWCIVRCCCCGMSCCCSCFQCLKCCGNCCGCCDPPGDRKNKYLDNPYSPPNHDQSQGYRNQAPMQVHFHPPAQSKFEPQQYAEFDVSKKGDGDALPAMPSWERSGSKKVLVEEEEEVEMSNLRKAPAPSLNHNRRNLPSPTPVSPVSMNYDRQYGHLPGSSSGHMSNHSQQDLLISPQSPGYGQPNQARYGVPNHGYNNDYFSTNRQSVGFGLDDPYDSHAPMSGANGHSQAGQQSQLYEAPGHQPYNNAPYGAAPAAVAGAAGVSEAMAMRNRNQSTGPYDEPYDAPQAVGATMGSGGRQSPALAQSRSPYGLDQIHEQFAEMPAIPVDHDQIHGSALTQQNRSQIPDQAAPRELAGSTPPEGYGMRQPGTADNNASSLVGGRPPYGMDPRMRNSPGTSQTPGSLGENPYAHPPRGSPTPRNDQGYGRGPPSSLDDVNGSYFPTSPRHFSPGPERQCSPAPDRQRTPGPRPLTNTVQPPSNTFNQSPPRSPFRNNSGFDFESGYSRPQEDRHHSPPAQSPTTAAYPGQRTYQPQ